MNDEQRALVEKAVMVLGEFRATKQAEAKIWRKGADEMDSETLGLLANDTLQEIRILTAVMNTLGDALAYVEKEEAPC